MIQFISSIMIGMPLWLIAIELRDIRKRLRGVEKEGDSV